MRTVVVLLMWATMSAAQQADRSGQRPDTERSVLQQLAILQAQLEALHADEARSQAELVELRKTYRDSHPSVVALRAKLDRFRGQEDALWQSVQRLEALKWLKQNSAGLQAGLPNPWWRNPITAQPLGLTTDQVKKMDAVFQRFRLKLIDLNAALEREEVTLEPLVAEEPLNESRIAAQIDRVAEARAELEKANGRMLLGIRKLLSPQQWSKLSQLSSTVAAVQR